MSYFRTPIIGLAVLAACASLTFTSTPASAAECPMPLPGRDLNVTTTVHQVGISLGVSDKVMLAGFEAGWVESHMNNLGCGDLDSLGVFQQRPSQGWGTPEQIRDVPYAATRFFNAAKGNEASHPGYTADQIAQATQGSAFPDRYREAEGYARDLLAEARSQVSTGKVYDNIRRADGSWQGRAVADGGSVSRQSVSGAPGGDMHLLTVANGKVFHNLRRANGTWTGAALADGVGTISDIATTVTPNGDLHLFTLGGGKVFHNIRRANGTWTGAALADGIGGISHIATGATPNDEVHLLTLGAGRTFHNIRRANGTWTGAGLVDNSTNVLQLAATGMPNGDLHVETIA